MQDPSWDCREANETGTKSYDSVPVVFMQNEILSSLGIEGKVFSAP